MSEDDKKREMRGAKKDDAPQNMRKDRIGTVMGMQPTPDLAKRVAELIRGELTVNRIANLIGVPKGILRRWLSPEDDATPAILEFARIVEEAKEQVTRSKEQVNELARRRIIESIADHNNPLGVRDARWWLQRTDPEFNPVSRQEHSGPNGAPISVDVQRMSSAELERELARLRGERDA